MNNYPEHLRPENQKRTMGRTAFVVIGRETIIFTERTRIENTFAEDDLTVLLVNLNSFVYAKNTLTGFYLIQVTQHIDDILRFFKKIDKGVEYKIGRGYIFIEEKR